METAQKVSKQQLIDAMKEQTELFFEGVVEAVNEAPQGDWIAGSEERVRDLSAEFRHQTFEKALQLRVDAAEAAFSPSAQPGHRQTAGEQRASAEIGADDQRPSEVVAQVVALVADGQCGARRRTGRSAG